jgi:hypothetical protein
MFLPHATGTNRPASVTQVRAMRMVCPGAGLDDAFRHINDQLADDLSSNRFAHGVSRRARHEVAPADLPRGGQGPILHYHASRGRGVARRGDTPGRWHDDHLRRRNHGSRSRPGGVVALTDGIYEYEDPSGKMFGDQRVVALIRERRALRPADPQRIVEEVTALAAGAPERRASDAPQESSVGGR